MSENFRRPAGTRVDFFPFPGAGSAGLLSNAPPGRKACAFIPSHEQKLFSCARAEGPHMNGQEARGFRAATFRTASTCAANPSYGALVSAQFLKERFFYLALMIFVQFPSR